MSYVIGDSAYLTFSAVLQTEPTWISLQMYCTLLQRCMVTHLHCFGSYLKQ